MEELEFTWDEKKRQVNIAKHKIDFEDAIAIFEGPVFVRRSDRDAEQRFIAIGEAGSRIVAVAYTVRGEVYRIISARRGRKDEARDYYARKAAPGG